MLILSPLWREMFPFPSNTHSADSFLPLRGGITSIVIRSAADRTMLRLLRVCGLMGVSMISLAFGSTMGPPADML